MPAASVSVLRGAPPARRLTVAPATGAPAASRTVPVTVPKAVWAPAAASVSTIRHTAAAMAQLRMVESLLRFERATGIFLRGRADQGRGGLSRGQEAAEH